MTTNQAIILGACIDAAVHAAGFIAGTILGARHAVKLGAEKIAAASKLALATMKSAEENRGRAK